MPKAPYQKPAKSLDDQLALLRERGLIIHDEADARLHLENISYYRLSGYTRYFADPSDQRRERFRPGVTFGEIGQLYVFDRLLRVLMAEAFERIEVAVKGSLAYHGAMNAGPFWMTDAANFDHGSHGSVMRLIDEACMPGNGKHKTQFLEAFYNKYSDPHPPAWMISEVLSFHGASILYKNAKGIIRIPVAARFNLQHDIMESWLHALVFARNVCAHHQRLWNRTFTIKPKIPKNYQGEWPEGARDKLYITCCIVKHMMDRLGGDMTWGPRLRLLINSRPAVPLRAMGFPDDWELSPVWGFNR
ncbi:MAG: Abi family protein [Proteobacteria bacterium]|nr:Abi family protein [Pseudomonadota bacterium]